jgi:hypothetical protein
MGHGLTSTAKVLLLWHLLQIFVCSSWAACILELAPAMTNGEPALLPYSHFLFQARLSQRLSHAGLTSPHMKAVPLP